jgi:hypothetical protein
VTQTGGLVVLLAWTIFAILLAILAYVLLRAERDPLQDLSAPTTDQSEATPGTGRPANGHPAGPDDGSSG